MKKVLIILLLAAAFFLIKIALPKPEPAAIDYYDDELDSDMEPLQSQTEVEPFYVRIKNGTMKLTPKADYDITARIVHKKKYRSGWSGEISRYDLALAWGKLNHEHVMPHIKYGQSGRWYSFRYDASCPVPISYIERHSANTHVIHASENLLYLLHTLKTGDLIRMEGYLVYADGYEKGRETHWHSSLTRNDTGGGACEVFYVNRIWHDGKIYQ